LHLVYAHVDKEKKKGFSSHSPLSYSREVITQGTDYKICTGIKSQIDKIMLPLVHSVAQAMQDQLKTHVSDEIYLHHLHAAHMPSDCHGYTESYVWCAQDLPVATIDQISNKQC
jgi:hypothetical protein